MALTFSKHDDIPDVRIIWPKVIGDERGWFSETYVEMEFINNEFINDMKHGAILINTARGALINDEDVANALISGRLSAAGIDVLETEPPVYPNPLIGLPNCIITPHIAWMPKETRQRVIDMSTANLESFLSGGMLNRIV